MAGAGLQKADIKGKILRIAVDGISVSSIFDLADGNCKLIFITALLLLLLW